MDTPFHPHWCSSAHSKSWQGYFLNQIPMIPYESIHIRYMWSFELSLAYFWYYTRPIQGPKMVVSRSIFGQFGQFMSFFRLKFIVPPEYPSDINAAQSFRPIWQRFCTSASNMLWRFLISGHFPIYYSQALRNTPFTFIFMLLWRFGCYWCFISLIFPLSQYLMSDWKSWQNFEWNRPQNCPNRQKIDWTRNLLDAWFVKSRYQKKKPTTPESLKY